MGLTFMEIKLSDRTLICNFSQRKNNANLSTTGGCASSK